MKRQVLDRTGAIGKGFVDAEELDVGHGRAGYPCLMLS
jgi:hypothetical protein